MTRRLLLSYIGLAIIILAALEIPLAVLAERHDQGLSAQSAEREASGLAVFASEDLEAHRGADLLTLVNRYQAQTGGEVSVVAPSGAVIAEADADRDSDAVHDDASLVQAALGGRTVDAFRSDEGRPWSVAAVPVADGGRPGGAVLIGFPATSTMDRIHEIWLALGLLGAGLVVAVGLLGFLLARSVTRPLGRLEAAVSAFGRGALEARAPLAGPPEVKDLSERFNDMAARLGELIGAQARFVADASHQLRSPLAALRLRLENLEAAADPGTAGSVVAATQEVQRLSRIVDGLLALGRADGPTPDRRRVDVLEVVYDRCEAWTDLADERGLGLSTSPSDVEDAQLRLVPGDLEQIMDNLLANAVDAVGPGGQVVLGVVLEAGGRLAIHVTDDGPGMSAGDRARAFDRFWQGANGTRGHSGLGLAIARQLATRNGADIELRQADPRGLDAVIVIPYPPVPTRSDGSGKASTGQKLSS